MLRNHNSRVPYIIKACIILSVFGLLYLGSTYENKKALEKETLSPGVLSGDTEIPLTAGEEHEDAFFSYGCDDGEGMADLTDEVSITFIEKEEPMADREDIEDPALSVQAAEVPAVKEESVSIPEDDQQVGEEMSGQAEDQKMTIPEPVEIPSEEESSDISIQNFSSPLIGYGMVVTVTYMLPCAMAECTIRRPDGSFLEQTSNDGKVTVFQDPVSIDGIYTCTVTHFSEVRHINIKVRCS